MKPLIASLLAITSLLIGCSRDMEETKGYVCSAQIFPLRPPHFKRKAKHVITYKGDTVNHIYNTHKRPLPHEEDSVIVIFPTNKPHKARVIRVQQMKKLSM